jgi:hypothetical protein
MAQGRLILVFILLGPCPPPFPAWFLKPWISQFLKVTDTTNSHTCVPCREGNLMKEVNKREDC